MQYEISMCVRKRSGRRWDDTKVRTGSLVGRVERGAEWCSDCGDRTYGVVLPRSKA